MAEWTIYGSNGVAKATVKELELHDEWMAECFITVSVKSAEPIDFAVGDYIDYRNERYSINYDPSKIKKARRGTYGEGFVYDNIKFVAVQDELVRCDFCDIVLSDNQVHYTQLPTFPFYCETVDDLLDRIQANMEDLYPGSWIIISPDLARDRQRGLCVGREQAFVNAYNQYIGEGSEFTYEKTGIALTVDNINCWEALAKVNSDFALNFIIRDRIVIVGTAGVFVPKKFKYGKGNGLYELEVIGDSEQKVVTRLKAYGSENNLPERYYATKGGRPFFKVSEANPDSSTEHAISVLIDNSRYSSVFTDVVVEVSSSQKICIGSCEIDGIEFDAAFELVGNPTCTTRMLVGADGYPLINGLDLPTVPQSVIDDLKEIIEVGTEVIFNDGVNMSYVDDSHVKYASGLPENMAINKLMLPGFPDMSLDAWVRENRPELIEEGFEFSTNPVRPYIDSPNKDIYGIRPDNIFFDGSNDTDEIYPTIEDMEWDGHACDVIVSADHIDDNGILPEDSKEVERRVNITIPYSGFDLDKKWTESAVISMKNGMCGARDFKILKKPTRNDDGNWECVCERAYDSTLHLYFPYNDFQVQTGDHFVLTGIDLPDSYVDAASEKLFDATMDALRKNHLPRVTFQPRIDHLWMARQHDTAMASGGAIESLHDTLKAGDYFSFVDEDFGVDMSVIIDILTIKEHADNGLATYEVTLRDEKAVSTLQKRLEKIASENGGGNSGGYSMRQTNSLVEQIGNDLYLSKVEDDEAKGLIGFLKGAWFGAKEWLIDATGSANLYDVTVNGLLKAYNAVINTVKSTAYSGDGMLDTGWRITDRYDGNNSKATFDYLYIRKKALFEELEIRKISHIGGDFALSPASGRAYRVEYYDADGEQLGVDEMTVPWMLGYKVMLLFSRSMANKYLGKRKLIDRSLTEQERQLVKRVRVYLFSDDGTTKTMSNWTVGAQARCQSFNITEQMDYHGSGVDSNNPDVSYWTGRKVQNTYWWRLVNAVGQGRLSDGKTHSYIEFLANTGNDIVVADTGSDLPAVGDEFCQFGHRTRPELSNVIMIETAREDSPSFKMYAGINSWDLTGKRVSVQSPTGWKVMSNSFEWITSYGELFKPTVNRGMWIDIEPDEQGKRRCYFNDMVSHNGAYWRCIVNEGTYTTDEPSESSAAWQKEVYAAIAPYLKFSDALVAVPCEKDSKATAALSKTVTVKIMVTNLEATITSITMTNQDSHVYLSGNNVVVSFAKGDSVPNKDYVLTVSGDLNGNHYTATDAISVYAVARGDDAYEVTTSPEIFIFSQQEDEPYNINIDKTENGNSSLKVIVKRDGQDQSFRITGVTASGKDSDGQATTMSATYNNTSKRVWITAIGNTTETGNLNITVNYGNNATQTITVPVYCNLIGTWKEKVVGDTKTEIAERTLFDICDETGAVIGTTTLANYTKSSSSSTATLQKQTAALAVEDARLAQELQTTKTTLESSISTTQSTLESEITSTSSTLSSAIASAKTELQGDISTVSTNLATYEQSNDRAVSALSTRVSNNETAITSTNTRVDTAEGSIQTIQTTVTSQGQQISATNTRVDTAESSIQTLNSQMAGTTASGLKTEITSTNTRVSTAEGNISTLTSQMAGTTDSGLKTSITNTNSRIDTANASIQSLSSDIQTVDGKFSNYSTTTQTATMISTEVTAEANRINGVLSSSYSTTTQTATMISNAVSDKVTTTTFNLKVGEINASITSVAEDAKTVLDMDKWENGSTDSETAGKTYDQIKMDTNTRIRTKTLIPITATTIVSLPNSSYYVGAVYFNSSKKTIVYSGSSAWRGWTQGGGNPISLDPPSGAVFVALVLRKSDSSAISTSEVAASKLYVSDSAFLNSTGIDITQGKINLRADKVTFCDSSGGNTDKIKINTTNGTLEATNAKLTGELVIQYGNNDGLKLDSSGNIMRWNGSAWINFFAQRYAKVVSGSSYTCGTFDDFLLASTDDMKIYLPSSPENGRQISVRNIGTGRQCVLKSKYQFVTGGGPDVGYESPYYYVVLYNDDRAELVFYNNKWYWNAMAT